MSNADNGGIPLSGSGFEGETPVVGDQADELGRIPLEGSGFEDEVPEDGGAQ